MARKIIVLERLDRMQPGRDIEVRVAFWLDVPAARQPFLADRQTGVSAVNAGPAKASAAELTAIESGQVYEVVETRNFDKGVGATAIQAALEQRHAQLQADVNADNPWRQYGTSFDGAVWTNVTVA